MHIVFDQQGRRSKFRDPVTVHIQGPSSLQVSFVFSTACWCSPTFVRRLFYFLLLRIPQKILSPPSDYNGTWSTSPFLCSGSQPIISQVFNKVWTWWSWYACVWWISWPCYPFGELYCDMDMLLTPGLRSTSTMWLRRFKDQFLKKTILYEFIKELKVWFDNVIRTRTGSGQVQW